jgi:hypothetical protein
MPSVEVLAFFAGLLFIASVCLAGYYDAKDPDNRANFPFNNFIEQMRRKFPQYSRRVDTLDSNEQTPHRDIDPRD